MHSKGKAPLLWRSALAGAALCALVGLALQVFPGLGGWLAHWSYDLAAMLRPVSLPPEEVVIVYMDEKSFGELQQEPKNWDRRLHAELIDWLTQDRARLVVLDVTLADAGSPASNAQLIRALRASGRVALAAWFAREENPDVALRAVERPLPEFEAAAKRWGLSEVVGEGATVVRQFYQGDEREPSLPWIAAAMAGAEATHAGPENDVERWLNYYGPPGTLRNVSFSGATNQPAGYFKDKCVFIGSWRTAYYARDRTDVLSTPHTLVHGRMPGVEIVATAFLNLLRNEWWSRLAPWKEQFLVVAAGLLFGFGLRLVRPGVACGLGAAAMLVIAACAILLTWETRVWSAWMIPVGAQIPVAVGWSCLAYTRRLRREKETLEEELTKTAAQRASAPAIAVPGEPPAIPDHVLLRRVGQGGYGEVWLARNAVGILHAVKIVHRRAFTSDVPYEREFKGIERFMPVSRSHPGLVQVLHVGRNESAGCFYYVMELADDDRVGQASSLSRTTDDVEQIQTTSGKKDDLAPSETGRMPVLLYAPRTLRSDLDRRGALPPAECVRLGVALAGALGYLHQRQLIHRDIKPANIIFVEGTPKLADIGLVTTISGSWDDTVSQVGTEGYVAPEGPGTAAADVYSLGKVLYEACMGQDRRKFPELPTAVYEGADYHQRMALNQIIVRACATKVEERYRTAAELRAELLKLEDAEA
jgi:CHASE2 domain-containing sensor protein